MNLTLETTDLVPFSHTVCTRTQTHRHEWGSLYSMPHKHIQAHAQANKRAVFRRCWYSSMHEYTGTKPQSACTSVVKERLPYWQTHTQKTVRLFCRIVKGKPCDMSLHAPTIWLLMWRLLSCLLSWGIRSRPSQWMCSFHTPSLWITAKDILASNCHAREFQP